MTSECKTEQRFVKMSVRGVISLYFKTYGFGCLSHTFFLKYLQGLILKKIQKIHCRGKSPQLEKGEERVAQGSIECHHFNMCTSSDSKDKTRQTGRGRHLGA